MGSLRERFAARNAIEYQWLSIPWWHCRCLFPSLSKRRRSSTFPTRLVRTTWTRAIFWTWEKVITWDHCERLCRIHMVWTQVVLSSPPYITTTLLGCIQQVLTCWKFQMSRAQHFSSRLIHRLGLAYPHKLSDKTTCTTLLKILPCCNWTWLLGVRVSMVTRWRRQQCYQGSCGSRKTWPWRSFILRCSKACARSSPSGLPGPIPNAPESSNKVKPTLSNSLSSHSRTVKASPWSRQNLICWVTRMPSSFVTRVQSVPLTLVKHKPLITLTSLKWHTNLSSRTQPESTQPVNCARRSSVKGASCHITQKLLKVSLTSLDLSGMTPCLVTNTPQVKSS